MTHHHGRAALLPGLLLLLLLVTAARGAGADDNSTTPLADHVTVVGTCGGQDYIDKPLYEACMQRTSGGATPLASIASSAAVAVADTGAWPASAFPFGSAVNDTLVPVCDDACYGVLQLPRNLSFFRTPASQCYINNNGDLTFDYPYFSFVPKPFPLGSAGQRMIAPFWVSGTAASCLRVAFLLCSDRTSLAVSSSAAAASNLMTHGC